MGSFLPNVNCFCVSGVIVSTLKMIQCGMHRTNLPPHSNLFFNDELDFESPPWYYLSVLNRSVRLTSRRVEVVGAGKLCLSQTVKVGRWAQEGDATRDGRWWGVFGHRSHWAVTPHWAVSKTVTGYRPTGGSY